jgi:hypothetical protein
MSKPETRTYTRVEVTKDGMRFRPRLVTTNTQRKEPKTMKYRDHDSSNPCLPAEVYPHLWATLLANPQPAPPSLWDRARSLFRKLVAATPVIVAAAFLPLADPPEGHYFRPGPDSKIHSLVWVQPLPGKRLPAPPTLPAINENPYSL